ncbi:MAG: SIMPL domain-containing protein [Chloroflexi bacterium]|nr:SIMPL domain-containing protein [Chloroflexota bacterium]
MRKVWQWIGIGLALLVCFALGVAAISQGWVALPNVSAQAKTPTGAETQGALLPRTVTVVGEGSVRIKPNVAYASIGVETLGESIQQATSESAKTMEQIVAALKAAGVAEKDMQTSGFSVWVDRSRSMEGELTGQAVYRITNMVNVTIRDLDKVGEVLEQAIASGANLINSVSFGLDQPEALQKEARQKAADDALAKAQELAALHNAQLGELVSVSEIVGAGGGYYTSGVEALTGAYRMMGMGGGAGPISPGELELALKLQVVYALK